MEHPVFAKLFETEEYGQILVTTDWDAGEEEYCVTLRFDFPDNIFETRHILRFSDESARDKIFDKIDEEKAKELIHNDYNGSRSLIFSM